MVCSTDVSYGLENLDIEEKKKRPQHNPVIEAVIHQHSHALQLALADPENINYINMATEFSPPLHQSCYNDNLHCVKLLLDTDYADLALHNGSGVAPVHIACLRGNLDIVKCFVETFEEFPDEYPLLIDMRTISGQSPLHAASNGRNSKDIVPYLLLHGAYAISADEQDRYPSYYCKDDAAKKMLLAKEAQHLKELDKINAEKASAEAALNNKRKAALGQPGDR